MTPWVSEVNENPDDAWLEASMLCRPQLYYAIGHHSSAIAGIVTLETREKEYSQDTDNGTQ